MARSTRPPTPIGAWVALASFYLVANATAAVYWLLDMRVPPGATLLLAAAYLVLTCHWLEQETRPYGQTYPLDMGMFLYAIGFVLIPFYMWRAQRWRGVLKIVVLLTIWIAMYIFAATGAWALRIALN